MELRAERGRPLVSGAPERWEPPPALRGDLAEWAQVAAAVCDDDEPDPAAAALVSARGRQLAARLATSAGTTVGYTDPVDGSTSHATASGHDRVSGPNPASGRHPAPGSNRGARSGAGGVADTAEPTPWATGLTVSAFVATITLAAVVTLVRGLAEMDWLVGVIGLAVVTAGLAPSIWLSRHTPLWRWIGYGAGAGLAVSWLVSALSSLG